MSLLNILIHPDPRLRLSADSVSEFNANLAKITEDMFETMYELKGIGLAATQVNIQQRIVVIDIPENRDDQQAGTGQLVLINPEILFFSEELSSYEEGCLSLPGQYAEVKRPKFIRYAYQDLNGQRWEKETDGLLATCIQHEIDHLNGVLFIDHISALKREMLEKRLAKSLKRMKREQDHGR